MKKFVKLTLIIMSIAILIGVLAGCETGSTDLSVNKIQLQDPNKKIEFVLGEVNLDLVRLRLVDPNGKLIESFVLEEEMLSLEDFKKLSKEGVQTVTVRYKEALLVLTIYIVKPVEKTVFTVNFHSNGGLTIASIETDVITALPHNEKKDFTFNGWYTDPAFNSERVIAPYTLSKDIDLYAEWISEDSFKVRFYDRNNIAVGIPQYIEKGKSANPPAMPNYEGFIFSGWDNDGWQNVQKDLDIYPIYIKEKFTIKFYDENQSLIESFIVEYNDNFDTTLSPIVPQKEGHNGTWIDVATNTSPIFRNIKSDKNIKPSYTLKEFTLSFTNEDLSFREEIFRKYGENLFLEDVPQVPYKAGYIGSWKMENGSDPVYTNIKSNMNIVARYEKKNYKLIFRHDLATQNIKIINIKFNDIIAENDIPNLADITQAINGSVNYNDGTYDLFWERSVGSGNYIDFSLESNRTFNQDNAEGYEFEFFAKTVKKPVTVTFMLPDQDVEGNTISYAEKVLRVDVIPYQSSINNPPNLPAALAVKYEFVGGGLDWDKSLQSISQDTIIYARIKLKVFKVEFYNWIYDIDLSEGHFEIIASATKTYNYEGLIKGNDLPQLNSPDIGEGDNAINFSFNAWIIRGLTIEKETADLADYAVTEDIKIYPQYVSEDIGSLGLKFEVYGEGYKVVGYEYDGVFNPSLKIKVIIPNNYRNKPVIAIGKNAFNGYGDDVYGEIIQNINILKNIKELDEGAFSGLTSLNDITLINNDNFIFEDGILYGKEYKKIYKAISTLNSASVKNTVEEITEGAFIGCDLLSTINFESSSILKRIGKNAFKGLEINTIELPSSLVSIESGAFAGCYKLTEVSIKSGAILKDIKADSFKDTKWYIENKNEILTLGDVLIRYNKNEEHAVLSDNIKYIADGAFVGQNKLKKITFTVNSSLAYIGSRVFSNCINLNEFEFLGSTQVDADEKAFGGILISAELKVNPTNLDYYKNHKAYASFFQE